MIKEQLEEVRKNIEAACKRAGRDPKEVTLIAVSKTKPVPMLEEAYEAGARDFGENKVQEIVQKKPELPEDIRWHMIGHLQRNKVHQVMGKAVLIHSVDSLRLAEQIETEAAKKDMVADILLEVRWQKRRVNTAFSWKIQKQRTREIAKFPHVRIKGLMTIAPFVENQRKIEKFLKNYMNLLLT